MGKMHSFVYKVLPLFEPKLLRTRLVSTFGRTENNVKRFANVYGFEEYHTDWKKVIGDKRIDIVNICLPPPAQVKPATEALEKGKNVICEKPIAGSVEEAEEMVKAAERGKGISMTMFNYRFEPAFQYIKKLIDEDFLGRIYRFVISFPRMTHVYPKRYFTWKDTIKTAGGGPLLETGVHAADAARFLVGEVKEAHAATEQFIKERPVRGTEKMNKVETEDVGLALLRFEGGALGYLEASKAATGNNAVRLEINGSKGAVSWDRENPKMVRIFSIEDQTVGWKGVRLRARYPFLNDQIIQGHMGAISYFLKCLERGEKPKPSFRDGLEAQKIIDAIYKSSREGKGASLSN